MNDKEKCFTAEFIENRLVVWDPKEGSELYKIGFYGKPLGIAKPKQAEFDVPLNVDLIEGFYLLEKGLIRVVEGSEKKTVSLEDLRKHALEAYENFDLKYMVYKDLREHGYAVLPGIKFGCDFAIYEHGPGIDHAPYLVSVRKASDEITATEVVRAGRLATTVRKRFIIAVPNIETGKVQYLMFKWFKA